MWGQKALINGRWPWNEAKWTAAVYVCCIHCTWNSFHRLACTCSAGCTSAQSWTLVAHRPAHLFMHAYSTTYLAQRHVSASLSSNTSCSLYCISSGDNTCEPITGGKGHFQPWTAMHIYVHTRSSFAYNARLVDFLLPTRPCTDQDWTTQILWNTSAGLHK